MFPSEIAIYWCNMVQHPCCFGTRPTFYYFVYNLYIPPKYLHFIPIPLTHHLLVQSLQIPVFLAHITSRSHIFFFGGVSHLRNIHHFRWIYIPRFRPGPPGTASVWRPPPDFGLPKLPKPDVDEIGLDLLARLPQDLGPLGPWGRAWAR